MANPVQKFAIILNGDQESRHLGNVDRAVAALRKEGNYTIAVASPEKPKGKVEHYVPSQLAQLKKLIGGLKKKMDANDQLVIYLTGHGNKTPQGDACIEFQKTCVPTKDISELVKVLPYGDRIVVMDSCHAGAGLAWFANARSTVVTQGSPGELVSCQTFAPFFWSDQVSDQNHDGKITVQERYQYAINQGKTDSLTQFYATKSRSLAGASPAGPFKGKAGSMVVHNGAGFDKALAQLKPGEKALVMFGADWCGVCEKYLPIFQAFQKKYQGQFLLIHAQGVNGSESEWFKRYQVDAFPTVMWFDHRQQASLVQDRYDPLASLVSASITDPSEQLKIKIARLHDADPIIRMQALRDLTESRAVAKTNYEHIWPLVLDSNVDIQGKAQFIIYHLARLHPEILTKLKEKFDKQSGKAWPVAGAMLAKLAIKKPSLAKYILKNSRSSLTGKGTLVWDWTVIAWNILEKYLTPKQKEFFVENLMQNLSSLSFKRRFRAAFALSSLGHRPSKSFSVWKESMKSSDIRLVRSAFVEILRHFPVKVNEIIPEIEFALQHSKASIRIETLSFIMDLKIKYPRIITAVKKCLQDPVNKIKIGAAIVLHHLKVEGFELKAQLEEFARSSDPELVAAASYALIQLSVDEDFSEAEPFIELNLLGNISLGFFSSGESVGTSVASRISYRRNHWEIESKLQGNILPAEEKPLSIGVSLNPIYHFSERPLRDQRLDPFIVLPGLGFRHEIGTDKNYLSIAPIGIGLHYYFDGPIAFGIQARPRIDISLAGDVKFGVDVPLTLKLYLPQ